MCVKHVTLGEKEFNIKAHILKFKSDEGHFFGEVLKPFHKKSRRPLPLYC